MTISILSSRHHLNGNVSWRVKKTPSHWRKPVSTNQPLDAGLRRHDGLVEPIWGSMTGGGAELGQYDGLVESDYAGMTVWSGRGLHRLFTPAAHRIGKFFQ